MEKDMFLTIKHYLEELEFTVKAEVKDIDIMAKKEDVVLLVEMKTQLDTTLIAQGIKRSALNDVVYLAIPRPSKKVLQSKRFKDKCLIVKQCQLGLLLVDIVEESVTVYLEALSNPVRKKKKKRQGLLKEFQERITKVNVGGVSQTKIVTAYKELALTALDLMKDGPKTTKELRAYTNRKKVVDIMQKNYYGWFERLSRGVYSLTDEGKTALVMYAEVIDMIKSEKENKKESLKEVRQ